jgi:hypothetical protein
MLGILGGFELRDLYEAMDQMIAGTRHNLSVFDGTPEEFLQILGDQFVRAAMVQPHGAGARNMALSVFLLARQQEVIEQLAEQVRMRDYALDVLGELEKM